MRPVPGLLSTLRLLNLCCMRFHETPESVAFMVMIQSTCAVLDNKFHSPVSTQSNNIISDLLKENRFKGAKIRATVADYAIGNYTESRS